MWLSLLLLTVISSSLGQLIAAIAGGEHRVASLLLSVLLISLSLVGGFYVSLALLPASSAWLVYLSPVSYTIPNLLHATLRGRFLTCTDSSSGTINVGSSSRCPNGTLTAQDIAEQVSLGLPIGLNVFILLIFLVVVKGVTLCLLKRRLQIQN